MAGNVWEWTASWYDDEKELRVVRGGSWYHNQYFARSAARYGHHPAARARNNGFRLVRRPPSR
jgi:formylglycine-generating enzyme required for sulfatase activity